MPSLCNLTLRRTPTPSPSAFLRPSLSHRNNASTTKPPDEALPCSRLRNTQTCALGVRRVPSLPSPPNPAIPFRSFEGLSTTNVHSMSTSDGERSPKRQRLESYSPASPPLHETRDFPGATPNTPPPSVRMSPSWHSQSSSNQSQPQPTSDGHVTIPTPPSTAGSHSQMVGRGPSSEGEGGGSEHGTPAMDLDVHGQAQDVEMFDEKVGDDTAKEDAEHRRSDHERDRVVSSAPLTALYKLDGASTPVRPSQPHPGADMMRLYSLQRIQASVARRDPVTGEKINKLRKSYENKVKSLSLEGRNKATPNQGELGGFLDPGWNMIVGDGLTLFQERHQGRELGNPGAESDLFSKLDQALHIDPISFPAKEHQTWSNLLGLDDPVLTTAAPDVGLKTDVSAAPTVGAAVAALAKTAPAMARNFAPASPRSSNRPERTGKKRRYDESSYAGYNDYEDDGQPLKQRVRV